MLDILLDALIDSLKILPILIVAFALLEILESRVGEKTERAIEKAGKTGPIWGSLLGLIPQCGFSVIGANFYSEHIITVGTLIAIFLSTSDEAFLVMLGHPDKIVDVFIIMGIKLVIATISGLIIDALIGNKLLLKHRKEHEEHKHEHIEHDDHDHCCHHHGAKDIAVCTLKRTLETFIFVLIANVLLGFLIYWITEDSLREFMLTDSVFQPLLTALIGLIPNCAPSVILATMYVEGYVSLGSVIAGLGTGAGVGLLMLFRFNKNVKENVKTASLLYLLGAGFGIAVQLIAKLF
ncbi:MAG: arsenic efflux protein [Clostridiales bacterium]|nr:arsenic efflux protein [Candidatus Coliplasma equi]